MHEIELVVNRSDDSVLKILDLDTTGDMQSVGLSSFYIQTNDAYRDAAQSGSYGLIPAHFAGKNNMDKMAIQAQPIETAETHFRTKFYVKNRCLIPVVGFIEYQFVNETSKALQKHLITAYDNKPFAIGGLWNRIETHLTFCILTVPAKGIMIDISNRGRNRMPLILTSDEYGDWLNQAPLNNFLNSHIALKAEIKEWGYRSYT